jgi:hypothetical protein
VVVAHREDDVAGLLLGFDVPCRLDHVRERVASIDDRPVFPRLDDLLEEEDVLLRVSRWYREPHFLVSDLRGPERQDQILEPIGCQVAAAPREGASTPPERVLADCVEDDVVHLAVLGEVFLGVVDDPVGSQRSHKLEVLRAAHRRDVGIEVPGQLHPCSADGARCAVDEDPLPFPEIGQSQAPECIECSVANRRRLLEVHAGRFVRQQGTLLHAEELRVCPEPEPTCAEDMVTDRELIDGCANGFDLSCQLGAEDPLLRSADAGDEAADEHDEQAAPSVGFTSRAVRPGDRRGVDLDEDLVLFGDRPFDFCDAQHVRRPIPVIDNCSHAFTSSQQFRCTLRKRAARRLPLSLCGNRRSLAASLMPSIPEQRDLLTNPCLVLL